jgi:hypothetical protein
MSGEQKGVLELEQSPPKHRDQAKQEMKKRSKKSKSLVMETSDCSREERHEEKDCDNGEQATNRVNKKRSRMQEGSNQIVKDYPDGNDNERKLRKKLRRETRKKTKDELMDMIPKKDESSGITYTKIQIRRMMKRVKRGLPPVPTVQEEQDRLKNEAMLRREEELELAGMMFTENESSLERNVNSDSESCHDVMEQGMDDDEQAYGNSVKDLKDGEKREVSSGQREFPVKRKSNRFKPVPPDYLCQACKNKHNPPHWIYDCPDKVTVRGTNQKKKGERGIQHPDSRKIFVSGLPFDVKSNDVCAIFEPSCGKISSSKLLTFQDTKRCNGQAILTLSSDQAAAAALKLTGTKIDWSRMSGHKLQKENTTDSRKDLKLKVTKVLCRAKTKKSTSTEVV